MLNKYISTVVLGALLIVGFSCSDDDAGGGAPAISGSMDVESGRGTNAEVIMTLNAPAGIGSLSVSADGGASEDIPVNTGATTQTISYLFPIPGESVLGDEFLLDFILTDQANETSTFQATVTTGKLIQTPTTYEFLRDGTSSVYYGGQTDRLNMVEEMKAVLLAGDAGGLVSEQVLLDMFANTGDNGGGNFSFSSTRQLKDKTFAPDLDDQLFENFFAAAAAASINGNNAVTASNGQAGLLTREDKGSTILVDANGREFTQLIEKGLMGAVFYNQIFSVYLSDARTGNDVENVELVEGTNYTPLEHHMDEAFGYWDPPLDFTSNWPSQLPDQGRFWSRYSNTIDPYLGTNDLIMNAYREARAAIVNNDHVTKNQMRDLLYEYHELVAAAVAVHYINSTLAWLAENKIGEAFHTLTEAWAFTNAIRYNSRRKITLQQLDQIMETDFGAGGNFWNVTPAGLNAAKATLVSVYTDLDLVKDDL